MRERTRRAKSAYARAGVDIDEMMTGLQAVKRMVGRTSTPGVCSKLGSFGGLFAAPGKSDILVASTDGVGTKLKVAVLAARHTTVGQDLVNHCVNDILVQGARPLFFLDYLGTSRLSARIFRDILDGICKACRENGCALLGGETAELPGLYPRGEYDLVGAIVGTVPRRQLVTGEAIRAGDVLIGLPSTGLHTNGYSLARKVIFKQAGLKLDDRFPGTRRRVADVLLAIHRSYLNPVMALRQRVAVRGMAHITGGGLLDNIPRVLPAGIRARVDTTSWTPAPLFRFIHERGRIDATEMYRVFNMGVGFVVVVRAAEADLSMKVLRRLRTSPTVIGRTERGESEVVLDV
jgi:phosphoribosylformylglycinamidine cyclo-ligase